MLTSTQDLYYLDIQLECCVVVVFLAYDPVLLSWLYDIYVYTHKMQIITQLIQVQE